MLEIVIRFDWIPATTRDGQDYRYPIDRSSLPRKHYCSPAVYRWCLVQRDNTPKFLVGETENLYKRIGEYLKHRSQHHLQIRERFDETHGSGGEVSLETVKFEPFKINDVTFSLDRLHDPFVRLVLENLCCLQLAEEGFQLLNATVKRKTKGELKKIFREYPEEASTILKEFISQKTAKAS